MINQNGDREFFFDTKLIEIILFLYSFYFSKDKSISDFERFYVEATSIEMNILIITLMFLMSDIIFIYINKSIEKILR
jgi:uncharacterized membrane protein YhdT